MNLNRWGEKMHGAKRWYFPDGFLPRGERNGLVSHESLCMMNLNTDTAIVKIKVLFSDSEPLEYEFEIPPMRDVHLRLDQLEPPIPREKPYGVFVESNVDIVSQLSRLDLSETHHTLMTTVGYSEG